MDYKPGNVVHLEIPAPDIDKLKAFYGAVFGWTFTTLHDGYVFFDAGNIAGALVEGLEPTDKGCLFTILSENISATIESAVQAGARALQPQTEVPGGRGSYAYFADPCGNKVGVWMR